MESDSTALATGCLFEGCYEIFGDLGTGSFGRVYRARQLSTGQIVTIKPLSPRAGADESMERALGRFRREIATGADLSHPNIVGLIDSSETADRQPFAVFAFVQGETLEQALAREEALGVAEAIRLMTQLLEAFACAHAQGIVHRDLKPGNLMLSGTAPRRNALVLELADGVRREQMATLPQTREFLGTPLYASPEQLAGQSATRRSDLYSWGLVFLECLTGRHPFAEADAAHWLLAGGGEVEIPEWLRGHRLGELLAAVTAREAENRDVTAEALLEALDEVARGELPQAPVASLGRPPPAPTPGRQTRTFRANPATSPLTWVACCITSASPN